MMEVLSVFSMCVAVLFSSILILIFYALRKKPFFIRHFGVFSITMLYLLCIFRMVLPLDLPFTVVVPIEPVMNPVIDMLYHRGILIGTHPVKLIELLAILWGLVALILLIRFMARYRAMCRGIRKLSKQENAQMQQMMDYIQNGRKRCIPIKVLYCPAVTSPCSFGIINKQILLPSGEYGADELYYILLHEYTHFRNHDLTVKMLAYIFRCVFWWNPAAYLLTKDLSQVLEMKCDSTVVSGLSNAEKADYLTVILKQLTKDEHKGVVIPLSRAAASLTGIKGKSAAQERFQYVLAYDGKGKKLSFMKIIIFGITFALLVLSYLFIFQSEFEAPVEDIMTDTETYEISDEEIMIRKNRDGTYVLIINEDEIDITEEFARENIEQGVETIQE